MPLTVRASRWDRAPLREPLRVLADGVSLTVPDTGPVAFPACAQWLEVRTATLGGLYERFQLEAGAAAERVVILAPGPSMVPFPRGNRFRYGDPRRELTMTRMYMDRSEVTVSEFLPNGAVGRFRPGQPEHPTLRVCWSRRRAGRDRRCLPRHGTQHRGYKAPIVVR